MPPLQKKNSLTLIVNIEWIPPNHQAWFWEQKRRLIPRRSQESGVRSLASRSTAFEIIVHVKIYRLLPRLTSRKGSFGCLCLLLGGPNVSLEISRATVGPYLPVIK